MVKEVKIGVSSMSLKGSWMDQCALLVNVLLQKLKSRALPFPVPLLMGVIKDMKVINYNILFNIGALLDFWLIQIPSL